MVVTSTSTQLKRQVRWPYRRLCRYLGVPYGSFPAVEAPPGAWPAGRFPSQVAKKVAPLTLEELHGDLYRLKHGRRTGRRSVGAVYRQYHTQISRRELTASPRRCGRRWPAAPGRIRHITWHAPAWSGRWTTRRGEGLSPPAPASGAGSRLPLKFPPGWRADRRRSCGRAPGAALRAAWPAARAQARQRVQSQSARGRSVLARYLVIPLNSPPQYPPYNGGMERAVRELKPRWWRRSAPAVRSRSPRCRAGRRCWRTT